MTTNKNENDIKREAFNVFEAGLDNSNLIEASAGTGKTWSITGLYLRMVVEKNLLPENILVVTFTKSATAELTGRIRLRLQEAMTFLNASEPNSIIDEIYDVDFFEKLFEGWEKKFSKQDIKQRLLNALSEFDKAAILTIHSFCQRLLNDYAFEAGGRFNLRLITDDENLDELIAADFWRKKVSAITSEVLNEGDQAWIAWLIKNRQSPGAWLNQIQKFVSKPYQKIIPPKSVKELSEKLLCEIKKEHADVLKQWESKQSDIIADLNSLMKDGYLHGGSYKSANLETYSLALNRFLNSDLELSFDEIDNNASKFSQEVIESKLKKGKEIKPYPFFVALKSLIKLHTEYCNVISEIFEARKQNLLVELLTYMDKQLAQMKSEYGLLDFDEMMLSVYKALKGEQSQILATAVTRQYQAALIDEFQDTDPLQLLIFQTLFAKTNTPLFYVGDPKQAIYSFRGADIFAYYDAAHETDNKRTLLTNYRSTPKFVDSVNALFSPPGLRSFITQEIQFDWVASLPKRELVLKGLPDAAMQFVVAESEDGKAFSKSKLEPLVISKTVQQIAEILSKAEKDEAYFIEKDGGRTKVSPSDIAILVPTHNQAKLLSQALATRGVLSVRQGQDKVLQSEAAKTLLRLMQAVAEPGDEARVSELLADPLVGFSGADLVYMRDDGVQWEKQLDHFWTLKTIQLESGFSAMFRSWIDKEDAKGLNIAQRLVEYVEGERHLTDLMHIAEILQQRSRQQVGLKGLINWLQYAVNGHGTEDEHQLRLESDTQRVKIVTLHASKGLEYNIVFCPFLWQGKSLKAGSITAAHQDGSAVVDFGSENFDATKQQAEQELLMEQLRLLYVALTRSVHHCMIFLAQVGSKGYPFTASSAIAWLLYGDESMLEGANVNTAELLRNKVLNMSFKDFVAGIEAFQKAANKRHPKHIKTNSATISIEYIKVADKPEYVSLSSVEEENLTIASVPTKTLYPAWLTTSFSGLSAGQHASLDQHERSAHADDVPQFKNDQEAELELEKSIQSEDESDVETEINNDPSIFTFPRGAMPGECLHSIFEHWDFSQSNKEQLKELIADNMNRFSIAKEEQRSQWYEPVANAVLNTLHNKINTHTTSDKKTASFYLAQVLENDRQAELEFLLSARGSSNSIVNLIANPKYQIPQAFIEASQQLSHKQIQGYLMGFIDLVFKDDQGVYHVLDWKSNYLGNNPGDYAPHLIEHAMAETHYYLQALLYLLALHRYLKHLLPDYQIEKHLGSAWYVFVRGVEGKDVEKDEDIQECTEDPNGFYRFKPPAELIEALDALLQVEEVAA